MRPDLIHDKLINDAAYWVRASESAAHDLSGGVERQRAREAEDVPDIAASVREQLLSIAERIGGDQVGQLRCDRCGQRATITIAYAHYAAQAEREREAIVHLSRCSLSRDHDGSCYEPPAEDVQPGGREPCPVCGSGNWSCGH